MSENIVLTGHTIELRLPKNEDIIHGNWVKWYNDNEITKYNSHGVYPINKEQELDFVNKEINNPQSIFLSIVEIKNKKLIGNVCLQNIDLINRHCNLAITVGEKSTLTAGFEAIALMTHHAFTKLNMKRIEDSTHENLEEWVKILNLLGYKEEGRGEYFFLKDGQWFSKIMFSVIDNDYFKILDSRNSFILFEKYEELVKAIKEKIKT